MIMIKNNGLKSVVNKLSSDDKKLIKVLLIDALRQSFIQGIMAGPNGNFYKWFDQKYKDQFDTLFHDDDNIGI